MATVAELDIIFNADASKAQSAFAMVQDTLFRTAMAGKNIGSAILGPVEQWVGSAIDLETEMNNVNSIAKVSQAELAGYTDQVQKMAVEWGQSSVDTAKGLYQIQSAGFSAGDSIQILESSSQAARAGLSTVEVASDAVTSVMKAYENQIGSTSQAYQQLTTAGEKSAYVQNILFRGVDQGKMTYDELAGSIGRVAASAAIGGIQIEEVTAAMAIMTQQGLSADESATALNNTITAFIKPSTAMTTAVQSMGYESAATMLQQEGLAGSMRLIGAYAGDNTELLGELFGNIRSYRGAVTMLGGDMDAMTQSMYDAQGGAGKLSAMESALAEQTKSTSFAIEVMKASIEVMGQELVQAFLPVLRILAIGMAEFAKFIISLPTPVKTFLGALMALVGGMFTLAGMFALWGALFAPIIGLLAAMSLAIAAVAIPLAALFVLMSTFGFRDVVQGFSDLVDALDIPFLDHFTNSIERAAEAWDHFKSVTAGDLGLSGIAADVGALGAAMIAFADSTSDIDFLDGPLGDLGGFLKDVSGPLQTFLEMWRELNGQGTTEPAPGVAGGYDTGQEQKFHKKYGAITIATMAWDAAVKDLNKTFPEQAKLIGQVDSTVKSFIGTMSAASAGNWDAAWASFKAGMSSAGDVAVTVGGNIVNALKGIDVAGLLAGAFQGAVDLGVMVLDGAIELGGDLWDIAQGGLDWLQGQLGLPEDAGVLATIAATVIAAITTVADWVGEFGDWVKGGSGQFKSWIADRLGLGSVTGDGTGGPEASGDLTWNLIATVAIDTVVKWVGELGSAIGGDVANLVSYVKGKLLGGATGGPGAGQSLASYGSSAGQMDLGTIAAQWTINVLPPILTGWINGAAGWLTAQLQNYVNGAGGGGGGTPTNGMPLAATGAGGGGVQLANWMIDVLEPLVNLTSGQVSTWIQSKIDILGEIPAKISTIVMNVDQVKEAEGDTIGQKAQNYVTEQAIQWKLFADTLVDINLALGKIGFGGGGGGTPTGGTGLAGGPMGMGGVGGIQALVEELWGQPLTISKIISILLEVNDQTMLGIDDLNNIADAVLLTIETVKNLWNTKETWTKDITIGLNVLFDDALGGLLAAGGPALSLLGKQFPIIAVLKEIYDAWTEATKQADDTEKAANDAAAHIKGAMDASTRAMFGSGQTTFGQIGDPTDIGMGDAQRIRQNEINRAKAIAAKQQQEIVSMNMSQGRVGAGGSGVTPQPPVPIRATAPWKPSPSEDLSGPGKDTPQTEITTLPQTGTGPTANFVKTVGMDAQNAVKTWTTGISQIPTRTQTQAAAIQPAFDSGFRSFGPAVQASTRNVVSMFDSGFRAMPAAATTQAGATVTATGTGLVPLAGTTGTAGTAGSESLRAGIGPMSGHGQAAGVSTVIQTGGALAPLPGITGNIGTNAGNTFAIGVAQGMFQAVVAAQVGAAGVVAAVSGIGSLYGQGYSIGASFGEGVAAGLYAMVGAVAAAAAALVAAAAGSASLRAQISSPSKLFYNKIGVPIGQGIAEGIRSQESNVSAAVGDVMGFDRSSAYTLPRSKVVSVHYNTYNVLEPEAWMNVQRDSSQSAAQLRALNSQARLRIRSKPQFAKGTAA